MLSIQGFGKMINKKATVMKSGQMVQVTLDIIRKELSMVKVATSGKMEASTKDRGNKTK